MQEILDPNLGRKLMRVVDDMLLESSPCEVCDDMVKWFSLYCGRCGSKNSNFDPAYIENSDNMGNDCKNNHLEAIEFEVIDQKTPYCSVCGVKVI